MLFWVNDDDGKHDVVTCCVLQINDCVNTDDTFSGDDTGCDWDVFRSALSFFLTSHFSTNCS